MSRWYTLASMMLLLMVGFPVSGRAQSSGWGPPDANVAPAGWHAPGQYREPPLQPTFVPAGYGQPAPYAPSPGNTTFEQLPDDTGWLFEQSPLERSLANIFRHSYFRLEYLLWNVSNPGNNILGSPTNFVADPTVPFVETNPVTGAAFNVVAPTLTGVSTNNNNGLRATFGLPIANEGTFETSVFALQTSTATRGVPIVQGFATVPVDTNGDGIPDTILTNPAGNPIIVSANTINAVAQPTLVDGKVPAGDNFFLINDLGYQYVLRTSLWGAEGNWVLTPYDAGAALLVSPMLGFRYLNFTEQLNQTGQYTFSFIDPLTGVQQTQPGTRTINSNAINNVYGPQIGMRFETTPLSWVSFGVQPKVTLGFNSYKTTLNTMNVLAPPDPTTGLPRDPPQNLAGKKTTFGVIGDLETYSRIHLGNSFSIFVAYNLMWSGLITRPADNIVYNIQSSPQRSNFALDPHTSGILIQGLSVGGEVRW